MAGLVKAEDGLTLLELVVVTGILALLSAIISLSVTGRSTETKGAAKVADEATMQRAMERFSGEHPQGRFPTLNGCLPRQVLDLVTKECVIGGSETSTVRVDTNNLQFDFHESLSGVDLNDDGELDDVYRVAPVIWDKAFKSTGILSSKEKVSRFLGNFIPRVPKHAFDFFDGLDDSWEDGENSDPDNLGRDPSNPSVITAPSGVGSGENRISVDIGQVPVWVIGIFDLTKGVEVRNLLHQNSY